MLIVFELLLGDLMKKLKKNGDVKYVVSWQCLPEPLKLVYMSIKVYIMQYLSHFKSKSRT